MKTRLLFIRLLSACVLSLLLLQGCIVYKIDIQQGNDINAQMLAELEVGMSKEEVIEVLGNPLVTDPLHTNRWDYYFYLKKGKSGKVEQRSATLLFSGDVLSEIKSSIPDSNNAETE